ncbi:hypothetical protein VNO78_33688 [Psophocarpus tetragonolobus]|uniref:Uncharacterized protein n=1 Tax=Psophocarpus tetragonolobus TaxID=3891 RepID=A0AAN9NYK2_PSOTE
MHVTCIGRVWRGKEVEPERGNFIMFNFNRLHTFLDCKLESSFIDLSVQCFDFCGCNDGNCSGLVSSSMAHPVDDCQTVKVIEQCQISPPPGSVPPTSRLLSFLDLPWVYCDPVQIIYFYEFLHSSNHFLQNVLPILKHSLSLTLQHFFPFAGNLVIPPKPNFPHILYTNENSISFTIAESTSEFTSLIADTARDVRDSHPFVPILPTPTTIKFGAWLFPCMAIQLTIFPNSGFSICTTFNHVVADARSFYHFMKFWCNVCREKCDFPSFSQPLPFLNRDIMEDPKGLKLTMLEELWNFPMETLMKEPPNVVDNIDKVRHSFVLSLDHVDKLKKWVSIACKSKGLDVEPLHISTFVVISSLMWVCWVQSQEANDSSILNDEVYKLGFMADCHNLLEYFVPLTYFGNCLASCIASLKKSTLIEENGIVEAVIAVGRKVSEFELDAMKVVQSIMSNFKELSESGNRGVTIAGSPKIGAYETDFGWGKPKKIEVLHIEDSGSISLSDGRDEEGGVEVGLVLGRDQMRKFSTILEKYLRKIEMDSQNMSYNAGQAKGQAEEKANTMMDKASNAAQSAQASMQEVGQQMQAKAQGAAEAVKNATGMNK